MVESWPQAPLTPPAEPTALFLCRSGQLGGMELRVIEEARWLNAQGWRARVLFTNFDGVTAALDRARAVGVAASAFEFPLFLEQWRGRHWAWLRAVAASRRWSRPAADLVHVPFAWTDQGLSLLWLGARLAPRLVASVHNVFPPWVLSDWHHHLLAPAFARLNGWYGVSQVATSGFAGIFGDMLPPAIGRTIPNFVDCRRFRPDPAAGAAMRRALGIPEEAVVIGAVGRLSAQKQPEYLLNLVNRVARMVPEACLHVLYIGDGELASWVQEQARVLGLGERVTVTGFIAEPAAYLVACDIHVLASAREGFGIATIEAMACGVPALATATPASHEILAGRQGGCLLPGDDDTAAAGVLARLVADPFERRYRGAHARTEAVTYYDYPAWEDRMAAFYGDVMGSTGGNGPPAGAGAGPEPSRVAL